MQNYFYDLHDQLVKAEIFKKDGTKETWAYSYDALGRRIGKGRLKNGEVSGSLEEETRFVWDGSHLLQEVHLDGRYTYIYTDPDSYEPLAQVRDWTTEDGESRQQIHYFHCDQIGIPREMTDKDGNLLWFGNYTGWGRLKEETKVTDSAYQPFRLQNQYADHETGLHYNFFRYYEPDSGRFVNQDPIGLWGGDNLYIFGPNSQNWVDLLGLTGTYIFIMGNYIYYGKGPRRRMLASMRERSVVSSNPNARGTLKADQCAHKDWGSHAMGFMVEYVLMSGIVKVPQAQGRTALNAIGSPGQNLYNNASPAVKQQAQANARQLVQDLNNSPKCAKKTC